MKKAIIILSLVLTSTLSFAQQECNFDYIYGMFKHNETTPRGSGSGKNSISAVAPGDSVYFLVNWKYTGCSSSSTGNAAILVDYTFKGVIAYTKIKTQRYCGTVGAPCDGLEYGEGAYKIGYKVPMNISAGNHDWSINPTTMVFGYTFTVVLPASIQSAIEEGKTGSVSMFDLNGVFVKESKLSDYREGLEPGRLYLYRVVFSDNSVMTGKVLLE